MSIERPAGEPARLDALRRYQVLDTPAEPALDDITRIAAYITKTPIALISLVDADRQWFKSKIGLDASETPRDLAFCAHAIQRPDEPFVVTDASRDERFASNPLVTGDPEIRFYAGFPLVTPDDQALGTLCVIDRVPRELADEQKEVLAALARLVVIQLEQRRQATELQESAAKVRQLERSQGQILDAIAVGVHAIDQSGLISFENPRSAVMLGWEPGELVGKAAHATKHHTRADGSAYPVEECPIYLTLKDGQHRHVEDDVFWRKDGTSIPVSYTVSPIRSESGDITGALAVWEDITERKRQQEASRDLTQRLHVLTERFQLAASAAGIGVWDWDVTNNVLTWDDTMHALYGTSPEGFGNAYAAWRDAVHPDDLGEAEGSINAALKGTSDFRPTFRIRRPNDEVRYVRAAALAQRDASGTATRMIGVNWDVTESRLAEERIRLVFEAAPSAMLMANAAGVITMVNWNTEELFGYTREELVGHTVERLIPDRLRQQHPALVAAFFADPTARAMGAGRELFGRRKNGTEIPIEIGLRPITTHEGVFTLASIIDITERKRAEERLRLVVEAAPNAMLMAEATGLITLVNRKAEELFGYTRQELVGQPLELLVPERFRAKHPDHVAGFFADPAARAMGAGRELFGRRKDGTEVPIEIGLAPIATGDGLFTLASIIDITERKHAENELRRSNADLEQFAYIASHDLQEPLRMVASYTELLAQRYKGKLDEKADKYIHYATDGAKRMQGLIADLLQFSRVGSQGKPLVPVAADAVMQRVLTSLGRVITEAGATVDVGPLPMVLADEGQLSQLFQNLVANAIKFRGTEAPRVSVAAVRDGEHWTFSVKDNGIGLDMQYAERVFQMFQRLHERGRYEGSGIGLSVAKRIVERHGGRIWLESAPGAGTTFFFTLPSSGFGGQQ